MKHHHPFVRVATLLLFPVLLAGCASDTHMSHHRGGGSMMMSETDMAAMCSMHKEMMSGKTAEQRQEMMARHMKSMSPQMQQHMQTMMQQCK
jgi:hypothetical protein